MNSARKRLLALALAIAALPVLLNACGGQEEPKTQVNAPEVVGQTKEAKVETPPAPTKDTVVAAAPETEPAPVTAPAEETAAPVEPVAEKVTPAEETPAEEVSTEAVPAEEMPAEVAVPEETPAEEKKSTDPAPELLTANDEVLIFFPNIHLGDSLEMIVRSFVQENYMNLVLFYVGNSDALMAEFNDNIHVVYCKDEKVEAIVVASIVNRNDNYGIIIFGKEGKVTSYMLPDNTGDMKLPKDYPPTSANFSMEDPEFLVYADAINKCDINEDQP